MEETLLINPRKRRKRRKRRARKNIEELIALNPRKRRRRARRNIEEIIALNPRRRRRRVRRNPAIGGDIGSLIAAIAGGAVQGISEKLLSLIRTKEDKEVIPAPIRNLAVPVLAFLGQNFIPKGKEVALGAIGGASAKVGVEILKAILPEEQKAKLGLGEAKQIEGLGQLTEEDRTFIQKMIPYLLEYKKEIESSKIPLMTPQVRAVPAPAPGIPSSGTVSIGTKTLKGINGLENLSFRIKN
jgi:hypothetical protein